MLYNTGTIAINGNTATGTGTNWTAPASQVRAGQTIIVMSNPVQMFQISSVNSATSMTVTPAASPALSGQKYGILVSDNISVDGLAQAMSQLIKEYDENIGAWETFATTSANQTITVTINGTSVNIPSIGALARKGSNNDITELKGLTTALSVAQGGTGAKTEADARTNLGLGNSATRNVGTAAGTVAAGDDSRLGTVNGKTGGTISSAVTINGVGGGATDWHTNAGGGLGVKKGGGGDNSIEMNNTTGDPSPGNYVNQIVGKWYSGSWAFGAIRSDSTQLDRVQLNVTAESGGAAASFMFYPDGRGTAGQWVSLSDERIKKDIVRISDPLVKMRTIKGCVWERRDNETKGYGFIAQDVEQEFPEAVKGGYDITLKDGEVISDVKTVDTYGVAAALHHEAILALMVRVDNLTSKVEKLEQGS
ncbi:tail fiber domain-containing protein [Escherichia coli]|nr:tail fiber domain-containing protein [Escherichia coli]EHC2023572.1 tail fiber domain-containing protein [Escherichia coli]EII4873691.1 tail fiber domain-containing protein [Escherichia coli]EJA4623634.1 tail fiber domain-containing protein [Escherichia coli]